MTLLTDGIIAHSWKITSGRLPGSALIDCLNQMFLPLNLDGKNGTAKPLLRFIKTDNIVQIERLLYAKICGERRLFNDIVNTEKPANSGHPKCDNLY